MSPLPSPLFTLTPAAFGLAAASLCAASWKICCAALKFLGHSTIAVPVAAAIFPPPPASENPEPTISRDARTPREGARFPSLDPTLPELPVELLASCDQIADLYASCARNAVNAPPLCAAISTKTTTRDLALLAWAAQLGYREGLEVR